MYRPELPAEPRPRRVDAEGVGPNELKPWNAAEESRKHEYDPFEAFGSVGSVFATIASAFTRRPMINALKDMITGQTHRLEQAQAAAKGGNHYTIGINQYDPSSPGGVTVGPGGITIGGSPWTIGDGRSPGQAVGPPR